MQLFRLKVAMAEPAIPRGAILQIDESQRTLEPGKVFALRLADNRLCIARVDAVGDLVTGAITVGRGATVIGELTDWWQEAAHQTLSAGDPSAAAAPACAAAVPLLDRERRQPHQRPS